MSQVRESVGTSKHGSTNALPGSGSSSMSLSLIAWKPRIDEPSNPKPSVNVSSSSSLSGVEKCCQVPGRSVNRTSTTCTPASLARRITSAGDVPVDAFAPVATVGSSVAVIGWVSCPESVRRFRKRRAIRESRGRSGGCQESDARTAKKIPDSTICEDGNVRTAGQNVQQMRYRDSTKCNSSTAENSPNRSCISFSFNSRKIQPVTLWCCPPPLTKGIRPRTAPSDG